MKVQKLNEFIIIIIQIEQKIECCIDDSIQMIYFCF